MFHKHFSQFPHHRRLFEKGDLKYIILNLVKDKPSHGYEIMRALEDSCHGFYSPSAGSVYPTLQMLEDMGYVSSSERDAKKVYTVTAEGKKFLDESREVVDKIQTQMRDWWGPHKSEDFHESMREMRSLWHLIGRRPVRLGTEKWALIKNVISRARREIDDIISQD